MQILVVGSETHVCNATECIAVQGHFRVNRGRWFWYTNRKRVFDFLLVITIGTFVVSPTVSEIRRLIGRKSPIRTHPTLIQRPRSGWQPSNFGMNVISPETRMMALLYGEKIMIVGRTMWTQPTSVTDGQTDGQNYDHKDRATHSVGR